MLTQIGCTHLIVRWLSVAWYNQRAVSPERKGYLILACALALGACVGQPTSPPPPSATFLPYLAGPPTATRGSSRRTVTPLLTPEPTPTPLVHIVDEGETLLEIANVYGVTLEALLLANPGINPRLLSVGQQVIIPDAEGEPIGALSPTATPIPATLSPVVCYPTPTDSLWCLTSARPPSGMTLEGLAAVITLLDEGGEAVASALAFSPLNLLRAGQALPLTAYFPPPVPSYDSALVSLTSAVQVNGIEGRYPPVILQIDLSKRMAEGGIWEMRGSVQLSEEVEEGADLVAVLAVAFDEGGEIVGFTKRELSGGLQPGEVQTFEATVFSLGPPIDHIEGLAEAQVLP